MQQDGFPFVYVGDKKLYRDSRSGGAYITLETAVKRLITYDDKYTEDLAMSELVAIRAIPAHSSEFKQTKVQPLDFSLIYEDIKALFPLYSRVTEHGERQIYFTDKQNQVTLVRYEDDDSLINSLMAHSLIWKSLTTYYKTTPLLEQHRTQIDMRTFILRIIKSHLFLDLDQCVTLQPKLISWEPSELAFKKFDANCVVEGDCKTWNEFTDRLDYPEVFKAWVWSLFEPHNNIRQVMWIQGRGADGKSAVQKALSRIFGNQHVFSCSKGAEMQNWFQANVFGKCLVNYADCDNLNLLNTQSIKQLTGGDLTSIEAKGVQAFSGQIYAKLFVTSNYVPKINPELEAHTSRLIKLSLKPPLGQTTDSKFEDRLVTEAYHFLYTCQQAYSKYINNGNNFLILPEALQKGMINECANETYYLLNEFTNKYVEYGEEYFCKLREANSRLRDFLVLEQHLSSDKVKYFSTEFDAKLSLKGVKMMHLELPEGIVTAYKGFKLKDVK